MRSVHEDPLDEFEAYGDEPSRLARVRRGVSTAIGAVVAISLLLALGVWFYRLGVRDAENVPIIRASAEPAKTRPEDPGGAVAPHQDITSYRAAESKPAQATAAIIAPQPPEPMREDVAMGALPPEPVERPTNREVAPTEPQVLASSEQVTVRTLPAEGSVAQATGQATGQATAPATAARAPQGQPSVAEAAAAIASGAVRARTETTASPEPLPIEPTAPAGETVLALAEPVEAPMEQDADPVEARDPVPNASEFAPPLTPRALPRPADLKARMVAAVQAAEQNASDLARRAAESSVQVQLAADPSEDVVRGMWRRISQANADLLHDRELAVQTTVSGGTKFYRLRVGPFGGVSEARAVCQALKARGQDCIVARNG